VTNSPSGPWMVYPIGATSRIRCWFCQSVSSTPGMGDTSVSREATVRPRRYRVSPVRLAAAVHRRWGLGASVQGGGRGSSDDRSVEQPHRCLLCEHFFGGIVAQPHGPPISSNRRSASDIDARCLAAIARAAARCRPWTLAIGEVAHSASCGNCARGHEKVPAGGGRSAVVLATSRRTTAAPRCDRRVPIAAKT